MKRQVKGKTGHQSPLDDATVQNLKDAGCDDELIDSFASATEEGQKKTGLSLLSKHRAALLDNVRTNQKRIDCLDYLIYQINKKQQ